MENSSKWAIGIGVVAVGALAYASHAAAAPKKSLSLPAGTKVGKVDSVGVASYNPSLNVWTLPAVVSYAGSKVARPINAIVARGAAVPPADVVSAVFGSTVASPLFVAPPVIPADKVIGKILSASDLQVATGPNGQTHFFTVKVAFSDGSIQEMIVPVFDPETIAGTSPPGNIISMMLGNFSQILTAN